MVNLKNSSRIMRLNTLSPSVPGPENEVYLVLFRAVQSRFCGQNDTKRTE